MAEVAKRYYLVKPGTEAYEVIERALEDRKKGMENRWAIIKREFPQILGDNDSVQHVSFGGFSGERSWAVKCDSPTEEQLKLWKLSKRDGFLTPRTSTKAGRALNEEMRSDACYVPGSSAILQELGIEPVFKGMMMYSGGIATSDNGNYVLILVEGMKPPADTERISDIEYERLTGKSEAAAVKS